MKKILLGAAAAALTATAAAPASAQYGRYDHRRGGIGEDIAVGVAVLGGVAAILGAINRDGGRYGYGNRYRYRDGYSAAVNSCSVQAERYGQGRVRITDVDRKSNDRFEVEGVVEGGHGGYSTRYDRRYDDRRYDNRRYDDRRYDDRRYDDRRYGNSYGERFTCVAYGNGRIRDFRMRDGYASRSRW